MEHEKAEQTAQVSRVNSVTLDFDRKVGIIEYMLREAQIKSEEYAQLSSGSV